MNIEEAKQLLKENGFIVEGWDEASRQGFLDKIESVKTELIRPFAKRGLKLEDIKWDKIPEEFWKKYLYKTNWLIADIIMQNKEWLKKEPIDPKDNWLYKREMDEAKQILKNAGYLIESTSDDDLDSMYWTDFLIDLKKLCEKHHVLLTVENGKILVTDFQNAYAKLNLGDIIHIKKLIKMINNLS